MNLNKEFYKGYYLMTSRCNLSCSYCVLENKPCQLEQELSLQDKIRLIEHLYKNLNFRYLTLSGGEVFYMGKDAPADFLEILRNLKKYKSSKPEENLKLSIFSNALLIDSELCNAMVGVIDDISITIDSSSDKTLSKIGRSGLNRNYMERVVNSIKLLKKKGIPVRLHSVVSILNEDSIFTEVKAILDELAKNDISIQNWKFYQYMSYDVPEVDRMHAISLKEFHSIRKRIVESLKDYRIKLRFKDNCEMDDSLFNILPYGNAQYSNGGTWRTTKRSELLFNYYSIDELFEYNLEQMNKFRQYHKYETNS